MFRDLPAMHLLRAFEASARCGSFTAAAAELGLTQGAVSQNVKALEQQVGRSLFRRHQLEAWMMGRHAVYPVLGSLLLPD